MTDGPKTAPPLNLLDVLKLLPQFLWVLLAFYVDSWVIIPTVEAVRRPRAGTDETDPECPTHRAANIDRKMQGPGDGT